MIPYCKNQNPLEIVRGTTNAFGLTVTDEDGAAYTLEEGQALVFGLRDKRSDERILIKQITHATAGEYYLELEPGDTADLEPGIYMYDVGMQHGSGVFYNVIEASQFTIKPNVTKLGDGA